MPKSKRDRPVTLSKTKKKGREHKELIVSAIKQALENYDNAYVFTFENMRNHKLKAFRDQMKASSRFFLGSNKVMQISLGKSAADEVKPGLHKLAKVKFITVWQDLQTLIGSDETCSHHFQFLRGDSGLLLTTLPKEEVERLFAQFEEHDFARTGSIATEKIELKQGPLDQFTHEMEPFLRKQGLPVRLNKGEVELISDFVVCEEGKPLSPESSRILRLLGIKMATFRLQLVCRWSPDDFDVYREGLDLSDIESS